MVSFIKELGYTGKCDMLSEIHTDHLHQPWRTFATVINRCISGKSTSLDRLRPSRAQILWGMFYKKDDDFVALQWEDFMFQSNNKDISSAPTPKKARKFKKPTSPLKKKTHTPGVSVSKKKTPTKVARSKGIELLSDAALLEEAQLKKALRRIKRETTILQAGGSSEGADFNTEVPDEPKGKSINTSEGTGVKPGVPVVSTPDSSKSENESWGDSGDEANEQGDDEADEQSDDDHEQADDERTKSDDEEEETQDDEYIHTPDDYVP
ncbi:hypothetical protein Tco_0843712 [Tanacetum coccineum]